MNEKEKIINQGLEKLLQLKNEKTSEVIVKPEFPENVTGNIKVEFPKKRAVGGVKRESLLTPILIIPYFIILIIIAFLFFDGSSIENFRKILVTSTLISFMLALITDLTIEKIENKKILKEKASSIEKNTKKNSLPKEYILTKKELEEHYSSLKDCLGKDVLEEKIKSTMKKEGEISGSLSFIQRLYENILDYLKNEENEEVKMKKNKEFVFQVDLLTRK